MALFEEGAIEETLFGDTTEGLDDLTQEHHLSEAEESTGHASEAEEAPETAEKKVEAKKRVIKNPQPKLNADRLRGPRGLATISRVFSDVKFKGKGYEKEYLDKVMWKLEHWCHRLYPKFQYDVCLEKLEKLGNKKVVRTYMNKIQQGILDVDDMPQEVDDVLPPADEFEQLLDEQIAQARSQPVPPPQPVPEITDEIRERIQRNREAALERQRSKRLAQQLQEEEFRKANVNNEDLVNEPVAVESESDPRDVGNSIESDVTEGISGNQMEIDGVEEQSLQISNNQPSNETAPPPVESECLTDKDHETEPI